jgi:2-dehydro-3-deoxyphosphogluconate aldolase/(4S)-4-hydroxy-2-oxoglutarate aldolase
VTASHDATAALLDTGVVAVVRTESARSLVPLAAALAEGGVRLVEITMTVPSALSVIEQVASQLEGRVLIGAGTVLDATTARRAIAAGARFVVAPSLDIETIETAHLYDVAAIPGCLTPTEIARAWSAGADVIKLFPGRVATPAYFGDLRGPFPGVRLMPTGSINLETAPPYIRAGAVAVGVGKELVDPGALAAGDWPVITERAPRFRAVVDAARAA